MIVATEKVLREADGPVECGSEEPASGGKVVAPGCVSSVGVFQDSDFAGDLEDSKSTSGGLLCICGCQTFVPISWMLK